MTLPHIFIEEQPEEAVSRLWAAPDEIARAEGYAASRRREFLAWRALLRRELGRDLRIGYDELGAPRLENRPLCISVSHARGFVAVAVSERRCAIDIESFDRNFLRVADHYLSPGERLLSDDPHWLCVAWSAKECLIKYAGHGGLDLIRDLHLLRVDSRRGIVEARLEDQPLGIAFSADESRGLVLTHIL